MANRSTLIGRRDYGVKIAMPGYDAAYAGDNQLLFNSSFPILQIKVLADLHCLATGSTEANFGGEYIGTLGAGTSRVFRWYHGLGFPPMFILLNNGSVRFNTNYSVDENYIYRVGDFYSGDWPTSDGTKVLLCPIDLSKDIEYPYTAMPLEKPLINSIDYGFKSVEFGDIHEQNFNNLGIDIRLQSQMVLAVKTHETSTFTGSESDFTVVPIDYTVPDGMTLNDVVSYGYAKRPLFSGDSNSPEAYVSVGQSGQAVPSVLVGRPYDGDIQLQTFKSQPGALVITRLPMVAANNQTSTF